MVQIACNTIAWYKVQFKQYQGIFLKHVDNSKLQSGNCNAVHGFLLPQKQIKQFLFQKTLAHNRQTSNNSVMITVLWRISEFSNISRLCKGLIVWSTLLEHLFHKPQHTKKVFPAFITHSCSSGGSRWRWFIITL